MKRWIKYCAGLAAAAGLSRPVWAQAPAPLAAPGAAAAAPSAAAGGAAAPAAGGGPQTIWSLLGLSKENCQQCKEKFCKSQLGLLATNGMKPLSALSGGIIPSCCPGKPDDQPLAAD